MPCRQWPQDQLQSFTARRLPGVPTDGRGDWRVDRQERRGTPLLVVPIAQLAASAGQLLAVAMLCLLYDRDYVAIYVQLLKLVAVSVNPASWGIVLTAVQ